MNRKRRRVKVNNTVYCPNCEKVVTYTEEITKNKKGNLDGVEFFYDEKKAFCDECKTEVMPDDLHDDNLDASLDAYREAIGIISGKDVAEIPEKYAIGKRPLSIMLGWGEQTLTRYLDGKIPSKEYSDELKNIYEDPRYYNLILERNREKITELAYEKSKRKVKALIEETRSTEPAIDRVANYLIIKCNDLTPLALQKGLYYCDSFSLGFFNEPMFKEDCQAWMHGPVYARIYEKYKEFLYHPIEATLGENEISLTASEKVIVDNVAKYLCCYSGKTLEKFTHEEAPWLDARKNVPANESSENIISKELMKEYFKKIIERYNMSDPSDIKIYAAAMFEKTFGY